MIRYDSGGSAYAQRSAEELGVADCFTGFLPMPQLHIDDVATSKWKLMGAGIGSTEWCGAKPAHPRRLTV